MLSHQGNRITFTISFLVVNFLVSIWIHLKFIVLDIMWAVILMIVLYLWIKAYYDKLFPINKVLIIDSKELIEKRDLLYLESPLLTVVFVNAAGIISDILLPYTVISVYYHTGFIIIAAISLLFLRRIRAGK